MVKDQLGQPLEEGDKVMWCNYNYIYMGVVTKVTARRARLRNIITGHLHMPIPNKIVKVEALPPASLFATIKGL